jgi:uncharacterized membrane protein
MNGTRHHDVGEYLRRLQRTMGDVPVDRREEILQEIEEHIAELLGEYPEATDADVRNVLERVGDPEDIAAEARERVEDHSPNQTVAVVVRPRNSWTDSAAIALLILSGPLIMFPLFRPEVALIGWFVAFILVWLSVVWSTRDKTKASLAMTAGLLSALLINGSGDEGFIYFGLILFASIWTPIFLGLKLRRASSAGYLEESSISGSVGAAPAETGRWNTNTKLILGCAIVAVAVTALLIAQSSDGADESLTHDMFGDDSPEITQTQFDEVQLGDSREEVLSIFGREGDSGSVVSGSDPEAFEEPEDVGAQQFDDCLTYSFDGSAAPGAVAVVCFDSSDEVVYIRGPRDS